MAQEQKFFGSFFQKRTSSFLSSSAEQTVSKTGTRPSIRPGQHEKYPKHNEDDAQSATEPAEIVVARTVAEICGATEQDQHDQQNVNEAHAASSSGNYGLDR
jgi:hypothetical protein